MTDLVPDQKNKEDITRQLRAIIDHHLFASESWPADRESLRRFHHFVERHGLIARVPGKNDTFRNTALGVQCGLGLAECFIGALDPAEIPEQLHSLGLIELKDMKAAWSLPIEGQDYLKCVEKLVRKAYARSFGSPVVP